MMNITGYIPWEEVALVTSSPLKSKQDGVKRCSLLERERNINTYIYIENKTNICLLLINNILLYPYI